MLLVLIPPSTYKVLKRHRWGPPKESLDDGSITIREDVHSTYAYAVD